MASSSGFGSGFSWWPGPELVARWIADVSHRPLKEVCDRLIAESRCIGHNVAEAARKFELVPYIWNDRLLEFYASTDSFLYDSGAWNQSPMKHRFRTFVCDSLKARLAPGSKVLCYGDGMGFDSAGVAAQGFDVTCQEVSGPCLDFADKLFQHANLPVKIETNESKFTSGGFDAIVCLDVLEHVPDPPAVVQQFSKWLKPDGLLLVHAPFYFIVWTRPTHLASNRRFAGAVKGLYGPAGFHLQDIGGWLLDPLVLQKGDAGQKQGTSLAVKTRRLVGGIATVTSRFIPGIVRHIETLMTRPEKNWSEQLRTFAASLPQGSEEDAEPHRTAA